MAKPILATNIDGLLIEHEAFVEPHKAWFDRAIEKTGDNSLEQWKGHLEYFKGVNQAMEKILPDASEEERTSQARTWYQQDVVQYIKDHPELVKRDVADKLNSLKDKYELILITTNTKKYINEILESANLTGIYDSIIASKTSKEPSKEDLVDELVESKGKPKLYLTGKPEDKIISKLKELEVKVIEEKDLDQLL